MLRKLSSMALLGLVLLTAAPTAAQAVGFNGLQIIDQRGDVWKTTNPNQPGAVAPEQQHGDMSRTVILHRLHTITVRMKLVELRRTGTWIQAIARFRTSAGLYREVTVIAGSPRFLGRVGWAGDTIVNRRNGNEVNCTVAHNIDYANNVVQMRIPRSCLGDPRWVQANAMFASSHGGKTPAIFLDGAKSGRKGVRYWTPRLHH